MDRAVNRLMLEDRIPPVVRQNHSAGVQTPPPRATQVQKPRRNRARRPAARLCRISCRDFFKSHFFSFFFFSKRGKNGVMPLPPPSLPPFSPPSSLNSVQGKYFPLTDLQVLLQQQT